MKIGDRVKVLNETSEGIIVKISGNKVCVDVGDFEFEYLAINLIVIDETHEQLRTQYQQNTPITPTLKSSEVPKHKALTEKERVEELGRVRGKRNAKGILEFDLHIHDLLVKNSHMSPGEMLNYQLDYAVHCLEETIRKREPALVFIHGVGKGVLKIELQRIIKSYGFSFHDGFMHEYGMGGTRVELRS